MVTPISGPSGSSGSNVAVLSTVILLNPEDLTKQPDVQAKEEAPAPAPVEASSVSISAQAALQSQKSSGKQPAGEDTSAAKPSSASGASSTASNTLAVDISYAAADADQNGVVSDAEQAAFELKHPEQLAAKNNDAAALSRSSSEALKAYETISAAGTET